VGQPIGSRYELEEQLGRGAFGSVWRGQVRGTGEAVAIKVLLEELATDADVVTRFLRERTALVNLRHRSLVAVRDLVVEGDVLALVMQLVEGPDLRAYLRGRGTLGAEEAALLVADVADALAVAHAAKIIHRDVKPANVLLQPEAEGFRPLLTDFGIARLADAPSVTRTSQVVGTPYYLSPEVIAGRKATGAVDVYAAGIMLYELLTGRPPFRGRDAMEVFQAHQSATAQKPSGVSDRLWAVASAALAKDPDSRPPAGELASRLRAAVRVRTDGTTVRLPLNPSEGTVVLPALPAELKIASGAGAVPIAPAWTNRAQPSEPQARPYAVNGNAFAPAKRTPQAQPAPAQPPPTVPLRPSAGHGAPPAARAAQDAPTTPVVRPAPSQGSAAPRSAASQPYPAQQQPNHYPMAYQQSPRPAPAQYRPQQQQTYQAPRNKAPRQPQTYAPSAAAQPAGLSLLSKLAILVIVLAVAIAAGVGIGKQLAKHHTTTSNTNHALGARIVDRAREARFAL
jgi:serine/threonine-protein kinase